MKNHNRVLRGPGGGFEVEIQSGTNVKGSGDTELVLIFGQSADRKLAVLKPLSGVQLRLLRRVFDGDGELGYYGSICGNNHTPHGVSCGRVRPVYLQAEYRAEE